MVNLAVSTATVSAASAWQRVPGFLAGKKTYLLAGVVTLTTVVLVGAGRLTPATGFAVLIFAVAGSSATLRSALAAHQAQTVAVLTQVAALGVAVAAHNKKAEAAAAEAAALQSVQLGVEIQQGEAALAAQTAGETTAEGKAL